MADWVAPRRAARSHTAHFGAVERHQNFDPAAVSEYLEQIAQLVQQVVGRHRLADLPDDVLMDHINFALQIVIVIFHHNVSIRRVARRPFSSGPVEAAPGVRRGVRP
jgi:hypothetical protein